MMYWWSNTNDNSLMSLHGCLAQPNEKKKIMRKLKVAATMIYSDKVSRIFKCTNANFILIYCEGGARSSALGMLGDDD